MVTSAPKVMNNIKAFLPARQALSGMSISRCCDAKHMMESMPNIAFYSGNAVLKYQKVKFILMELHARATFAKCVGTLYELGSTMSQSQVMTPKE